MHDQFVRHLKDKLEKAGAWPLKAQAQLSTAILKEKMEMVLPWAMERSGVDVWVVAARENGEDPVLKTLFTWDMPLARRISVLIFYRNAETGTVRKLSVGMHSPEMTDVYENAQKAGETVWESTARILRELDPEKIAVNRSRVFGFCDGMTSTVYEDFMAAIGTGLAARVCDGEDVAMRWLQRVTPLEKKTIAAFTDITHDIILYSFSRKVITPGTTTTTDVEWVMRSLIYEMGYEAWFGPDVDLQRRGSEISRMSGEVILPGDILHCDIGFRGCYVRLHTDMQWIGYILPSDEAASSEDPVSFLPPEEKAAVREMQALLDTGNRFRGIVMKNMILGRTGNEVFENAVREAKEQGIRPMLYSHPVGTFGHGAGPMIGLYTNQGFVEGSGEKKLEEDTCYALELNVYDDLAAWDGQTVFAYLEENICQGTEVGYLSGHQTELIMI